MVVCKLGRPAGPPRMHALHKPFQLCPAAVLRQPPVRRADTHPHAAPSDAVAVGLPEDLDKSTRSRTVVQWYPGHIARAERQIISQLNMVDVVFEVLDARIPLSTTHPQLADWAGNKPRFVILNRRDMITPAEKARWTQHFKQGGVPFVWTNGKSGDGVLRLIKESRVVYDAINRKRTRRGLKPRSVKACMVGFPNIGKSALINRLAKRRVCESAARPGVTRSLRWVRMAEGFDLLDAPGIIPMSMRDQAVAARLAMCNDIGEASYVDSLVAAALVELTQTLSGARELRQVLWDRYGTDPRGMTGETYVQMIADATFQGDVEKAGVRLLGDYRAGRLGYFGLEEPPLPQEAEEER